MLRFQITRTLHGECTVVGEFDTMEEVMDFYDKELSVYNPEGVYRGEYTIDDMTETC